MVEEPAAQPSATDRSTVQSRKHKAKDGPYRPPKHANATGSVLETVAKRQSIRLAGGKPPKVSNTVGGSAPQDPATSTSTSTKGAECDDSKATNSAAWSDQVDDSPQNPAKATSSTEEAERDHAKVTISAIRSVPVQSEGANTSEGVNQTSLAVCNWASSTMPVRKGSVPPDSRTQGESCEPPKLGDPIQSTPAHQNKAGPIESPETEEIYRGKIPTSFESVRSSPGSVSTVREDARSLADSILESIRIVHGLSKYQDSPPRKVHATILRALRDPSQGMFACNWSNGSMWMDILERGSVEGQKVTILNMLEYMGVWEWYDS